jgi:hypothetical protein
MHDIGYYAGFLSPADQNKVNAAPIGNLAAAIINLSDEIWQEHDDPDDFSFLGIAYPETDRDRLALIRGLCDRIESKITEVKS